MTSELLLILVVTLLVFNPKKWPMVMGHAAKVIQRLKQYQALIHDFWQKKVAEINLADNERKATKADASYRTPSKETDI